jgi:hypothetical protein
MDEDVTLMDNSKPDQAVPGRLDLDVSRTSGDLVESTDIGGYAVELAVHGWPVFPLRGKTPAIASAHPDGDPLRGQCKGACGRDGHGVLDATTDVDTIRRWWLRSTVGANIGVRLPENVVVIDVDPRNGGASSQQILESYYGPLPETLSVLSGRGDGGTHRYYRRPLGRLTSRYLGDGIDVKTSAGYVVAPPSIHPDSGRPYRWIDAPIAEPPAWLVDLIRPLRPVVQSGRTRTFAGTSIADDFSRSVTWGDVLEPHGWHCLDADGDRDGARWVHPAATSAHSATIRYGCLFTYSPNTPLDPTETGDPRGYTRFRAWAVLNHDGDLSVAAKRLRTTGAI